MKKIISAFALVLLFISVKGQQPTYAGIRSDVLNYYAAQYGDTYQKNSQWCWAASIKMVLNYYGVSISQEQIVARTYGTDNFGSLPDWPGSMQAVHANLNNWGIDNFGQKYSVSASFGMGAPTPAYLINELSNGHPVIIGYNTGNGGHAVVVTAVSYISTYNGPMIQTIVVRDPWPSAENLASNGRVEYPGSYLASKIQAYWYIRVYK